METICLRRYRDWEARLHQWATGLEGQPFRWGETDCASLLLGALHAMSPDPLGLPRWHDARSARRARPHSADALLRSAGLTVVSPPYIQPGDLAVIDDTQLTCGVSLGPWAMTAHRREGVRRTPLSEFDRGQWYRLGAMLS